MKKTLHLMVLYSMSMINENIAIETKIIKEDNVVDISSQNIKLELENNFLTFKDNMNASFNHFKDEVVSMVTELRESVFTLKEKVSVISKEVDMIKIVGSTAIGIMITGFSFLYTQMNQVRQEMKTEINQVRQEVKTEMNQVRQEMNAKFDKLYDLILNKK